MIEFVATGDDAGERVDVVLARRAHVTRALAQRALRSGAVTVAGTTVRPSHRLEAGERVTGELPDPAVAPPEAEDIPIEVRYDDDRVLVVSKPAGLVTHPARGHDTGTLVNALLALGVPLSGTAAGSTRPGIVHRLDKDTSGLLLIAKDDEAQSSMVDALRRREIKRSYLALVRGVPSARSGTVDAPVGRHPTRRTRMAVVPDGRPSVTHYRTIASADGATLLDVTLETGRTHQIRVHMAHLGHPVLGDRTYGGYSDKLARLGLTRPFLHAYRIAFPASDSGREVVVTDPLPDDLAQVLEHLGLDVPVEDART